MDLKWNNFKGNSRDICLQFFSDIFRLKLKMCFKTMHERISGILFATPNVLDIRVNSKREKQRKKIIYLQF